MQLALWRACISACDPGRSTLSEFLHHTR